jgi:hypothetical protein
MDSLYPLCAPLSAGIRRTAVHWPKLILAEVESEKLNRPAPPLATATQSRVA